MSLTCLWSFFPAISLALILLIVLVVDGQTTVGIMSIKNNLPYRTRIQCTSNEEMLPFHVSDPGDVFQFHFDCERQVSWTCSFEWEDKDGTFVMWERPDHSGLCDHVCPWKVGEDGLSLLRSGGNTVLIYFWR